MYCISLLSTITFLVMMHVVCVACRLARRACLDLNRRWCDDSRRCKCLRLAHGVIQVHLGSVNQLVISAIRVCRQLHLDSCICALPALTCHTVQCPMHFALVASIHARSVPLQFTESARDVLCVCIVSEKKTFELFGSPAYQNMCRIDAMLVH